MRLVNLGPGEITDRLTILALKILYSRQSGRPVDHFETERNALLTQIRSRELNGAWFEQVLALGAVNGALWRVEDEIRELRKTAAYWDKPDSTGLTGTEDLKRLATTVMPLAFRIQELNDERAKLIETINKQTGDHLGAEKLT